MKQVKFQGKHYTVPDWANYITMSECGIVTAFADKPHINYHDHNLEMYWQAPRIGAVYKVVSEPVAECREIE